MPRTSTQFTTTTSNLLSARNNLPHLHLPITTRLPTSNACTFTIPHPSTTQQQPNNPNPSPPDPSSNNKTNPTPPPKQQPTNQKTSPPDRPGKKRRPKEDQEKDRKKKKRNVPPNPLPRLPLPAPLGLSRPPLLPGHGLRQLPTVCRRAGAAAACEARCAGRGLSAVVCPLSSSSSHFCGLFLLFGLFFVWVVFCLGCFLFGLFSVWVVFCLDCFLFGLFLSGWFVSGWFLSGRLPVMGGYYIV